MIPLLSINAVQIYAMTMKIVYAFQIEMQKIFWMNIDKNKTKNLLFKKLLSLGNPINRSK